MYTSNLRKVGGSVMLAVSPAVLELLQLQVGASVSLAVENGRLVIEPMGKKRYTMKELLAQCDATAPMSSEDKVWTSSKPTGRELI